MMTGNLKPSPETSQPMAIRIQPLEFEISAENPFEHDLLGRAESIKALTTMIGSIEGPCVMAVDASWGMGKTTFLRMWAQHLRNEQFPVVEFNAWETDFAQDPFIALTSEIATGLQNLGSTAGRLGGQRLRSAAASVARTVPGATARVVVSGVPLFGSRLAQELEPKQPSLHQTMVEHYDETKAALQAFRGSLADVAAASAKDNNGRALVVLVDELDRCRPTYAVELLEAAKHLFNVDQIVFVLCLDRAQLASSVNALYGESFDADGYLWRFFDIDYRLPTVDRLAFITTVLTSTGVTDWLQTHRRPNDPDPSALPEVLRRFLSRSEYSLRRVLQAIHRLGAVLASMSTPDDGNVFVITVLLLLRTIDPELYHRAITGESTDIELIERLLGAGGVSQIRSPLPWAAIEGVLISCVLLFGIDRNGEVNKENLGALEDYLRQAGEAVGTNSETPSAQRHYAASVVGNVEFFCGLRDPWSTSYRTEPYDRKGVEQAVRFLELFSNDVAGTGLT